MKIELDFGKNNIFAEVPDKNIVNILKMNDSTEIADPIKGVEDAITNPIGSPPLSELAKGKKTACVVICDITRPVPNKTILPPILTTLENSGIKRKDSTILIATGIHRPNLGEELIQLVGEEIAEKYNILNHYAKEKANHTLLGTTSKGTAVILDSTYVNADLKITTGFIEPHLMAGFSGGRKLVCPGIASLETVKIMHSPKVLEQPNAREGIIQGNPFHEEVIEMVKMVGMDFMLNVALDENRQITGIFAGNYLEAHAAGVIYVNGHVRDTVSEPVDIVITTSAGFPLDTTFYQAIKGLTAVLPIIKQGGTIILAAECSEGLGSEEFSQLVRETKDMDKFMQDIMRDDYFVVDQWQFEEFAKVLRKAEVYLYSAGITDEDKEKMLTTSIDSIEDGIAKTLKKHGESASIAVIPKGPYILTDVEK